MILSKALEAFADYGYAATGVQELCDAAGVTKPTLYHYFGSKRGLLDALLAEYLQKLINHLSLACVYKRDLTLNIMQVIGAYFVFAQENPQFYRLQVALATAPLKSEERQAVEPWSLRQHALLNKLFEEAVAQHGNMRGREALYALSLMGMINVHALAGLDGNLKLDQDLLYRAAHQFMHGIFS